MAKDGVRELFDSSWILLRFSRSLWRWHSGWLAKKTFLNVPRNEMFDNGVFAPVVNWLAGRL